MIEFPLLDFLLILPNGIFRPLLIAPVLWLFYLLYCPNLFQAKDEKVERIVDCRNGEELAFLAEFHRDEFPMIVYVHNKLYSAYGLAHNSHGFFFVQWIVHSLRSKSNIFRSYLLYSKNVRLRERLSFCLA